MNAAAALFTFVAAGLIFALPRRLAITPLLLVACYMPREAILEIGSIHFTVFHILVLFGIFRIALRRERLANGRNAIDRWLILWAMILIATSFFHSSSQLIFRIGMIWSDLGCYFVLRVFIQDADDIRRVFKLLCAILVPLAASMLMERWLGHNYFSVLGADGEVVTRHGQVRARGPFAHPILAGTVGAACFPMALYLWKRNRIYALFGLSAAFSIVLSSASSGPVMMVFFALFALALWQVRESLRTIRWLAAITILLLDAIMKDPVYFLMARIDVAGGSTGWYRARLIQSSIEHLGEWWLVGTDYTKHWMPTGIKDYGTHADIVNHLLGMGVNGGLALMLAFVLCLRAAFHTVGKGVRESKGISEGNGFLMWTLGAILFGHVMNFFSISLFDQSVFFVYLTLAAIGTMCRHFDKYPGFKPGDYQIKQEHDSGSHNPNHGVGAFADARVH